MEVEPEVKKQDLILSVVVAVCWLLPQKQSRFYSGVG